MRGLGITRGPFCVVGTSCTLTQASWGSPVGWMGHAGQHAMIMSTKSHQVSLFFKTPCSCAANQCIRACPSHHGHPLQGFVGMPRLPQACANFVGKVQVVGSIMCDHSKRACMVPISWGQASTTLAWQRSMMGLPTGVACPCLGLNIIYDPMRAM